MEEYFNQWLTLINSPLDIERYFEDIIYDMDMLLVYNGVYYVNTTPCNDSWFTINDCYYDTRETEYDRG